MAEIEYSGIKIGGSKLLLIVPLLATIIGGLWGGFELYSRYLSMEKKIDAYTAPDLSGFDKRLDLIKTEMGALLSEVNLVADVAKELKNDLRGDVRRIEKIVEDTEQRVKNDSREFQTDLKVATDQMESDMKELEEKIELKINRALNNPLNKVMTR